MTHGPRWSLRFLLLGVGLLLGSTSGDLRADPLDRVSGTEEWGAAGPENLDAERREWYRARVKMRRARVDFSAERARNQRLAALRGQRDHGPDLVEVRRVLRMPRNSDGASVEQAPSTRPASATEPGRPGASSSRKPKDRTPDPPPETRIPLERLDSSGQAIDEEGDEELRRLTTQPKATP